MKMSCRVLAMSLLIFVGYSLAAPSRPLPERTTPPAVALGASRDSRTTLPWSENFESGAPGWTFDGFFNVIPDPQTITVMHPTINPNLVTLPDAGTLPAAHGGIHSLWYGEQSTGTFVGSDFDQNQPPLSGGTSTVPNTGWAITPDLDLTTLSDANLTFWTVWEVEGVDVPWYDVMYIEASTDGGANWNPVGSGQLNPLDDVNANPNVGYSSGGVGLPPVWVHQSFSLAPFCGNVCWIRFRFDTVDQLYNGFRGWFIDDILVEGAGSNLGPVITDVSPGAGQIGDLIFVYGENFVSGAEISCGGIVATSAVLSSSSAHFIVPDLPDGVYDVMLTNPDGQFDVCSECFEITEVGGPTISFLAPDWAYPGIPTPVTIEGQNFDPGATVTIGGLIPTDLVIETAERITCVTPGTLGIGFHAVRVTNPDGQYDQCTGCFQVKIPASPTDLVVHASANDIVLNWQPSPEAGAEYRIYRDSSPDGLFTNMVGDVNATTFTDHNVLNEAAQSYFYIVRAYIP